jgi:hypothetical protein
MQLKNKKLIVSNSSSINLALFDSDAKRGTERINRINFSILD